MSDKFDKLAKLAYNGASMRSMCTIFNLEETALQQLMEMDGYKTSLATVTDENIEFDSLIDKGWDGIEEAAMTNVLHELKHNPDPEYALKAAAFANKAIRNYGKKSVRPNVPIGVQNNMQAVIHVHPKFAGKLQNNYVIDGKCDSNELSKKIINALDPSAVKCLLGDKSKNSSTSALNIKGIFDVVPDIQGLLTDNG